MTITMWTVPKKPSEAVCKAAQQVVAECKSGSQVDLPDFLSWIADRLVNIHRENPNADFVVSLRSRSQRLRGALAAYDQASPGV